MLLFLQDLKGDSFDIPEKFDKLWVDNCPDFKTVPAHIIELNVRNCASFKKVPKTVKYLAIYNCPLYLSTKTNENKEKAMRLMQVLIKNEALPSGNEEGIKNWLKALNETYPPDEMQLQSYVFEPNQRSNKMTDDIKEALKDVTMDYRKDAIFIEVLKLRAYVARLLRRVDELERQALP